MGLHRRKRHDQQESLCGHLEDSRDGQMPKGSFVDSDGSVNRVYTVHDFNGYLIKTYEIYLYIWLDKYRRDMKDEPVYSHKVRLKYISSEKK